MKKIFLFFLFISFQGQAHVIQEAGLDKMCRERNIMWQMRDCVRQERDECFFKLQICCQYEIFDCRYCMKRYDDCVWAKAQASACVPEDESLRKKTSK